MNGFENYSKIIFFGGGIMAERLYSQIDGIENRLIGVVDLLNKEQRVKKSFMGYRIDNAYAFEDKMKDEATAVVVSIGSVNVYAIVTDFLTKFPYVENRLFVVNPYSSLRFFFVDDELAAEERIPVTDVRYQRVRTMFEDELSLKIYDTLIHSKPFENNRDRYELIPYVQIKDMYWCREDYWNSYSFDMSEVGEEATVLDCGAYIGDSVADICNAIPQKNIYYYAAEPLEENIREIESHEEYRNICRRFEILRCGVGSKDEKLYFKLPDNGDKEGGRFVKEKDKDSSAILEIRSIDGLDLEVRGDLYIKMDIEGAEMDALMGARKTIEKYRPYLAICLYHRKNDLLEIPEYINSLGCGYEYYLRGGYHTILWAVPRKAN